MRRSWSSSGTTSTSWTKNSLHNKIVQFKTKMETSEDQLPQTGATNHDDERRA